jgi:hypothetical protein
MAYIVQRKDRFYVVAYDGLDPLTGKERRRWHPAGHDRHDAEQMVERIGRDKAGAAPARGGAILLGEFLTGPRPTAAEVPDRPEPWASRHGVIRAEGSLE